MIDNKKWEYTMRVFDEYERRFAKARTEKVLHFPTDRVSREAILKKTKSILKYDEKLVPEIHSVEEISHTDMDICTVTQLRYETWDNVYSSASLYMPYTNKPVPLVFVLCGHGDSGRLTKSYAFMAYRLAKMGIAAIVPDNIGQGDREMMGHWHSVGPFYCGLTLQGMIVMETVALIRHMKKDNRFDSKRFASCGNSGGGTLNLFLSALAPELCALSSSGYPSEFSYIFSKERYHCSCNLLPGSVSSLEMWEIFSLFAPKPLFLEQGENDSLFPYDYAQRNARKLKNMYIQMGAPDNFSFDSTKTTHSWASEDRYLISKFLSASLNASPASEENDENDEILKSIPSWHVSMPDNALTTDEAASLISGISIPDGITLPDIYPPMFEGKKLSKDDIIPDIGRGDVMRVLSQMECALSVQDQSQKD